MYLSPMDKLSRLMDEYDHTLALLKSPRLTLSTRRILESLKQDLEHQISQEQAKKQK